MNHLGKTKEELIKELQDLQQEYDSLKESYQKDISKQKLVGKDQKSEQLSQILEATSGGVWDWNIQTGDTVFSPRYSSMLGYTPEEFADAYKSWKKLVHPDDFDRVHQEHMDHFHNSKDFSIEFRMLEKSGNWHWIHARGLLIERDKQGNPLRMVGTHTDIQERKKAELELIAAKEKAEKNERGIIDLNAELEQGISDRTRELTFANKELESFSYSVSHDLRAPLRAINGFSHILMEEYGTKLDDEGKRICSVIQDNSEKMDQLIADLLEFSRIVRKDMNRSDINMKEMVTSIYNELCDKTSQERINFNVGEICPVQADPHLIKQVWINLLANAVKYSSKREKAIISVSCRLEDSKCIYCLQDNGVGFNMEFAPKLFEVFQRLHGEKEFKGTGVGLAIVQRIIHRHGGEIWAESEVDKGTAFYFTLPHNDEPEE